MTPRARTFSEMSDKAVVCAGSCARKPTQLLSPQNALLDLGFPQPADMGSLTKLCEKALTLPWQYVGLNIQWYIMVKRDLLQYSHWIGNGF